MWVVTHFLDGINILSHDFATPSLRLLIFWLPALSRLNCSVLVRATPPIFHFQPLSFKKKIYLELELFPVWYARNNNKCKFGMRVQRADLQEVVRRLWDSVPVFDMTLRLSFRCSFFLL